MVGRHAMELFGEEVRHWKGAEHSDDDPKKNAVKAFPHKPKPDIPPLRS